MELQTKQFQPLIGIIGLPRSGTTILSNIFNSCDNGFSLNEPIWASESSHNLKELDTEKTGKIFIKPPVCVPSKLREIIRQKEYGFGAIKETYRTHQIFCVKPLLNSCDIIVFSFREPTANFASWKRTGWGGLYNSVDFFIRNYIDISLQMKTVSKTKPIVSIIHEDLCSGRLGYFNERFRNYGELCGELNLTGIREEHIDYDNNTKTSFYGDGRASTSLSITPSNQESGCVTKIESSKIKNTLGKIYDNLHKTIIVIVVAGIFLAGLLRHERVANISVSGVVFEDINRNGVQDNGEKGISGVVVYNDANNNGILDNGEINTITDENGMYRLDGLKNDIIRQIVPNGYKSVSSGNNFANQKIVSNISSDIPENYQDCKDTVAVTIKRRKKEEFADQLDQVTC